MFVNGMILIYPFLFFHGYILCNMRYMVLEVSLGKMNTSEKVNGFMTAFTEPIYGRPL